MGRLRAAETAGVRARPAAVVSLALLGCLLTGPAAHAATGARDIIVKRDPHLTSRQRAVLRSDAGVVHVR
ncbi:MAG: hypothetical protein QOC68_952, partial [Solirubrobacteraceae bacterium]|nr:hypothetical protein [Solirubrobacteraceae bacterium]